MSINMHFTNKKPVIHSGSKAHSLKPLSYCISKEVS